MALLLKADELVGLISIEEAVQAVKLGFMDQAAYPSFSSPRIRIQDEDRRVSVHPGGCHSLGVCGTFIHTERFTFVGGAQQYASAGKRVYVCYDSETAELKTIIVGSLPLFGFEPESDWYGTETAITSAVGTDALACKSARSMGLYGTGRQARRHLLTMCAIRPELETVKYFSRDPDNRAAFLRMMQPLVGAKLTPAASAEAVSQDVDMIVCATGSNVPVLKGQWLRNGQHVTSIVASNKGVFKQSGLAQPRREFDDDVISRANIIVATSKEQAIMDEQADLFHPVSMGLTSWDAIANLGEVLINKRPGRSSADEITLFKQNSDQGVGFMALAKLAHEKALAGGIGQRL